MLHTSLLYRAIARTADRLLPLGTFLSPKLAEGDRERRRALGRWRAWGAAHRDRNRPLLWCHAPSVGEGLQAEAVLRLLRAGHPEWQIAYSFFSPSARNLARRQPADACDFLPYDTAANVDTMLEALAPRALVFTKLDLWPELATRARGRGVRTGMIAATVSPVSGRLREPARSLTRPGYEALELAGAISEADGGRLQALGTPGPAIRTTGDPRFDSALAIAGQVPDTEPILAMGRGAPTLVAGSTWPPDQAVLLAAFARVLTRAPDARLILVPHEPTSGHLEEIDRGARAHGLEPVRLSTASGPVPLLVVDRLGVLAALYRAAAMAYVGGGFGTAGLHSVLEPAAASVPVIVGPRWRSSREAGLLLDAGAAVALSDRNGAAELERIWLEWLRDPPAGRARGERGYAVVASGLGAAGRNAALVEELMEPPNAR